MIRKLIDPIMPPIFQYDENQAVDSCLYRDESLTSMGGHKLEVFENSVLRKQFGCKKKLITASEQFRTLHKKEICNSHRSVSIVWIVKFKRLRGLS
jgi:hypothetical protein